ncbi:MAG: indolepyruvate oxidoreductase subunit beta [Planctomycetaceae bacterium]|nr:indolepyruvate oxidoreductase subunit beta [Planctomycetaceae bacterium]
MTTSVVLVGVGGQGILLASEIAAQAAVFMGYDVKTNEVHGMAQRGGSVVAQIRYGREVFSPIVSSHSAQVLGSLERIEGLRNIDYLAKGGLAVISNQKIVPVTASTGGIPYPEIGEELLLRYFPRLVYIDAVKHATELGNPKAANTVLLGAMATKLNLSEESWFEAIRQSVKEKFIDINIKSFKHGFSLAKNK